MNVPVARPQVTAFLAAVRAQCDDLSPEEVDELTEGLEADLNDALTDAGTSPAEQFGDPAVYAAELRSAAGLPARAVPGGEDRRGLVVRARGRLDADLANLRARPWWPGVRDFVVTLRPAWWVARAGVAAGLLTVVLGINWWVFFLLLAIASVELGRRGVAERTQTLRALVIVGNVIAAVLLLPVLAENRSAHDDGPNVVYPANEGLWVNGSPVNNLFPYDSEGRPLTGVQLYDQDGNPVVVGEDQRSGLADAEGRSVDAVPAVDAAGLQRWNVYPLRRRSITSGGFGTAGPTDVTGPPSAPAPPGVSPGPLLVPAATASPAGPTAGPTASPTTSPSVSAGSPGGRSPSVSPSASPSAVSPFSAVTSASVAPSSAG